MCLYMNHHPLPKEAALTKVERSTDLLAHAYLEGSLTVGRFGKKKKKKKEILNIARQGL